MAKQPNMYWFSWYQSNLHRKSSHVVKIRSQLDYVWQRYGNFKFWQWNLYCNKFIIDDVLMNIFIWSMQWHFILHLDMFCRNMNINISITSHGTRTGPGPKTGQGPRPNNRDIKLSGPGPIIRTKSWQDQYRDWSRSRLQSRSWDILWPLGAVHIWHQLK